MRQGVLLVCLLVLTTVASCADTAPSTEVVVCLTATPQVMADAQSVTIRVYGKASEAAAWEERASETHPIAELPLTVGVHPRARHHERLFRIEVEARGAAGVVAVARMSSGFVADDTRGASLELDLRCASTCAEDQTCRAGSCVDAAWATDSLPEYAPGSCRAGVDAGLVDQGSVDHGAAGDAGGLGDAGEDGGSTDDAGPIDAGGADAASSDDAGLDDSGVTMSMDLGTDVGPIDVGTDDMGWDGGTSADAAVDGGAEVGRRLVLQMSAAAHAECPGGGFILSVYFDEPLAAPGPGQALDVRLPGPGAFSGHLGVSAFCPSNSTYRDWAPFVDQTASAAGLTTITLDGVDLADTESMICNYFPTCPFGQASYWTTPRVPLHPSLNGMCTQAPVQCPDWCQAPC